MFLLQLPTVTIVLIVITVIMVAAVITLYFLGKKAEKRKGIFKKDKLTNK